MSKFSDDDIIDLNVGGEKLSCFRKTLTKPKGSNLEKWFNDPKHDFEIDEEGNIFFDRDSEAFRKIINCLRTGRASGLLDRSKNEKERSEILRELKYFGLMDYFNLSVPNIPVSHINDLKDFSNAGLYSILFNKKVKPCYCQKFQGKNWMLVRRCIGSSWVPNTTDQLKGNSEWGKIDQSIFPTQNQSFSYPFGSLKFTHFLFATGDMKNWLICHRDQVYLGWGSSVQGTFVYATIEKSSISQTSYQALWCKRPGCNDDPWISIRDHWYSGIKAGSDNSSHSMLYGQSLATWNYFMLNNGGCNVWIS